MIKECFLKILLLFIFITSLYGNNIEFSEKEKTFIQTNKEIILGSDSEWAPYVIQNEDGTISGYDQEVINLINEISGLNIKLLLGNWGEIKKKAKNKQIDGLSTGIYAKYHEPYFNFTKPYINLQKIIFTNIKGSKQYLSLKDLKGKTFAIHKNNGLDHKIAKSIEDVNIIDYETVSNVIEAVSLGKADAMLGNGALIYKLTKTGNTLIKPAIFLKEEPLELVFSIRKDWEELISIINKSLNFIGNRKLLELKKKWFFQNDYTDNLIRLNSLEKEYLDNKKEITVCIDPNWMPFEKNENGKHIGMSADYIKLFEKSILTPIRMIPTKTWLESLSLGKKKECDIFSLVMPTPERTKYLDFTKEYLKTPLVIVSSNSELFISNISELENKKVGIVNGYAYAEILNTTNPKINFVNVKNLQEGLDKVKDKELFAFIGGLATVGYQLQNNYIGQLKISGKIEETLKLGIGTRKDEPLLKSIFNKAILRISKAEHQEILNNWVSINYQEGINYETIWRYIGGVFIILMILIILYRQYLLKDLNKKLNEKVKIEIEKNNKHNEILSQQSKMAAMGEMIGNIAHQWRQPLSIISTSATGAKLQNELGLLNKNDLNSSFDTINNTAQYLSQTIEDFRGFFNPQNSNEKEFFVSEVIKKALNLISAQFTSKDIEIIQNIEDFKLEAVENELIQVLINILNNAKDALDKIEDQKRIIFITTSKSNNNLIIEIKDNANGIPKEIINRIFEPYFTTKHQSQGTGIGLYMSQEIVKNHLNGILSVSNETYLYEDIEYSGAKFTIQKSVFK